nr:S41 family peptidase [bacterium]
MISKKKAVWMAVIVAVITAVCAVVGTSVFIDARWVRNQDKVLVDKSDYTFLEQFNRLKSLNDLIGQHYYGDVDENKLVEGALKGAVDSLGDAYSAYFNAEEAASYFQSSEGIYAGIGVRVQYDEEQKAFIIVQLFSDSPAKDAGVLVGDVLIGVGQGQEDIQNVIGMDQEEVISLVSGDPDTLVRLELRRGSDTVTLSCIRRKVQADQCEWRMLADSIGYIKLDSIDGNASTLFDKAIIQLTQDRAKGLIIDVRNNPGGGLDDVIAIADRFLPQGTVLTMKNKAGEETTYSCSGKHQLDLPVTILVNGYTASAAEVLACAVKELGGGTVVGTQTFGKGIAQSFYSFDDGAQLKITSEAWFSPNGNAIHGEGLLPDVIVDLPEELKKNPAALNDETDTQLQKAIEVLGRAINP